MVEMNMQPRLISVDISEAQAALELFPGVWQAAEQLGSQDSKDRHRALDELLRTNAPRISPLVAYLLTTRIFDPDIELRMRVVEALANVMRRDTDGNYAVDSVRSHIISGLSYIGEVGIVSFLELGMKDEALVPHINKLLNFAPKAGDYLKQIAGDRNQKIEIRRMAIFFIGHIGYFDAISELKRIRNRIESRQAGQKRMPFAPPTDDTEEALLQEIQKTLSILRLD